MINHANMHTSARSFKNAVPFDHCIIEEFFDSSLAFKLEEECPGLEDDLWHVYDNAIEVKKTTNIWHHFGPNTYRVLSYLNSPTFVNMLSDQLGIPGLKPDIGLNGGGWHIHGPGGLLNAHLDYSLHPKLGLQRKLNLIIYLNSEWQSSWGGSLGFWDHCDNQPANLVKSVTPSFNRAVLFDTTQQSWHGLTEAVSCPQGQARKSLAVYYLVDPPRDADPRSKALFAPTEEQKCDPSVLSLIKKRASSTTAHETYKEEKK